MNAEGMLRLYCKFFDLTSAKNLLEQLDLRYKSRHDKVEWFKLIQGSLRVYQELKYEKELQQIKQDIFQVYDQGDRSAEILYFMGRFNFDQQNLVEAESLFAQALVICGDTQIENQIIFGTAILQFYRKNYEASLQILKSLHDAKLEIEMLSVKSIWLGQNYFSLGLYQQSLEALELAKAQCKKDRNLYMLTKAMFAQVELYHLMGRLDNSYSIIQQCIDIVPNHVPSHSLDLCHKFLAKIEESQKKPGFELIESEAKTVLKSPGEDMIELTAHRQLILLLKEMTLTKGKILEKERICELLWGVEYHPLNLDNKIYVTIRRLRKLIGDDSKAPKYILNKEQGYYWNTEYQFTSFQHRRFEVEKD